MKVLLVEPQRATRRRVRDLLASTRVTLREAATASEARDALASEPHDLVLFALRLGESEGDRIGLEVLRAMRSSGDATPAVLLADRIEPDALREAMRLGAQDALTRDELTADLLAQVLDRSRARSPVARAPLAPSAIGTALVGSSPEMERLRKLALRVAESMSTVLIRGETGSGKELIARAIHASSSRHDQPFLAVNCAAMPGPLIESMLFGHERGAFTGAEKRVRGQLELAGRGTLLLDEVAEIPPDVQAKLLRVLEERRFRPLGSESEVPVTARIIAATHQDLERRIEDGRFRQDLFYRLNVVALEVPSLGERIDDIPELVAAFTKDLARPLTFTADALAWLRRRPWAGNVRELRNVVERVSLLAEDDVVDARALATLAPDRRLRDATSEVDRLARELLALPDRIGSKLRAIERAVLHHAIETCGGNKSAAARMVGVDRKALERRWERLSGPREPDDEP